jgi:hypothetical protein
MDDYSRSTSARATPTSGNSRLPSDRGFGTPYSLDSGSPAAGGSQFDDDESAVFGRNFSRQLSAAPRQPSMENGTTHRFSPYLSSSNTNLNMSGLQTRAQPQQNSSQFSRTTAAAAQPLVVSGFGTSPQVVDQIANAHSLTTAQRVDLHAFARVCSSSILVILEPSVLTDHHINSAWGGIDHWGYHNPSVVASIHI